MTQGITAPGFEAVREAFAANFTEAPEGLNEQAARFSVCIGGETVVDLWAGWADAARTRPFDEETLFAAARVIEKSAGGDFAPKPWW